MTAARLPEVVHVQALPILAHQFSLSPNSLIDI